MISLSYIYRLLAQPPHGPLSSIHHTERTFHSWEGSHYCLPSDGPERARLQLQHDLLKRHFDGSVIFPDIKLPPNSFVLDCGAGSGTWILDAAQNVPNDTTLYGVDIEPRLFPFLGRKNVHFSVASVTALPSYWTNTFQLVNQRLLVAALTAEQWKLAVQELKRVLAPGGALQLGEVGVWRAGPKTQRHLELMRALFTSRTLVLNCASQIPAMLDAAGFASISTQKRSLPLGGSAGADGRRNFIDVFRGMKTPVLNAGGYGVVQTEKEFDDLLDAVEAEWEQTPDAYMEFFVFTARKPGEPEERSV